MKLLLDENLSRRNRAIYPKQLPRFNTGGLIGLERANDRVIRQYAIDNGFIITTQDADFYEMSLIHRQPAKIVWLKMGNQSKTAIIKTLLDNQQAIKQALIFDNKACIEIV